MHWRCLNLVNSWTAGGQVRNPARDKVMQKEAWQNARTWSGFRGSLCNFLNIHHPKNKNLQAFVLCFSTLLIFSGKSQLRALVFCIWKGCFSSNPLWKLSSLPNRFPQISYSMWSACSPQLWEAQSLKASERYRAFSRELKIILVTGFHCWLNDCCQASIFFIF